MAIHDLQHRLQPEFPEVSANGEWDGREYLFRNGARSATLLLADSEVGKEDVLNFYSEYGVTADQVKVLPFLPAHYLTQSVDAAERKRVRAAHHLPERYLYYPAQFWPHKNHQRIVEALALLKQRYDIEIPIVFTGTPSDPIRRHTYQRLISTARQCRIEHLVYSLGFVSNEDMSALYAEAVALVMPTFFGPTNIPVLEAWSLGCPVITSNIRGIREQVGDELMEKYLSFLKGYLAPRYAEFIGKEIQTAYLESYSEFGQNIFDRYVTYADYWIQDSEFRDPDTGEFLDRAALNAELEKIEKPAGISNPKDFRNEIVNFVLRARAHNAGKNPSWTSYEKLREVIEKKMFSTTEDLLPVISFNAKSSSEDKKKHEEFVNRMVMKGYTPKQVRLLCEWHLRTRKSS